MSHSRAGDSIVREIAALEELILADNSKLTATNLTAHERRGIHWHIAWCTAELHLMQKDLRAAEW